MASERGQKKLKKYGRKIWSVQKKAVTLQRQKGNDERFTTDKNCLVV